MKMTMKSWKTLVAGGLALSLVSANVWAFADDDARRAILELREQVRQLNGQLETQRTSQINLLQSITRLEDQNRVLTGRIEELTNRLAKDQTAARTLLDDVDARLKQVEPSTVELHGVKFVVRPEERQQYEAAQAAMNEKRFGEAAAAFYRFRTTWPDSGYLPEALYLEVLSHYGAGHFKKSLTVAQLYLKKFPQGPRAADAQLSIGTARMALGDIKSARANFLQVKKRYPDTEAARRAAANLDAMAKIK